MDVKGAASPISKQREFLCNNKPAAEQDNKDAGLKEKARGEKGGEGHLEQHKAESCDRWAGPPPQHDHEVHTERKTLNRLFFF